MDIMPCGKILSAEIETHFIDFCLSCPFLRKGITDCQALEPAVSGILELFVIDCSKFTVGPLEGDISSRTREIGIRIFLCPYL